MTDPILRAVDTNILVRLIVIDNQEQYGIALDAISNNVIIPVTVLLETGWVLSSQYAMTRDAIMAALSALMDFPTIHVADEPGVRWALARYAAGADLADMLHLVAAGEATGFVTFDRKIAAAAGSDTPVSIETLKPR